MICYNLSVQRFKEDKEENITGEAMKHIHQYSVYEILKWLSYASYFDCP